jgi:hypothetical protein
LTLIAVVSPSPGDVGFVLFIYEIPAEAGFQ